MKVVLSGYYGFGNAGDEALLEGLTRGLAERGHTPLVLSGDPTATRTLHGVSARHRVYGVPAALLTAEAFVSGGGGLLQDVTSSASLRYYLGLLRIARSLGKRVAIYGQSIGPLSHAGRQAVAKALAGVPIAVRDEASLALLAGLGLNAQLVGDPALLLDPPPLPTERHESVLLIPRAGHPRLTDALAELAERLLTRGCRVSALALHPAEDRAECLDLGGRVPQLSVLQASDHHEALGHLVGARAVVSARLHGLILATVTRTPAVGLVYDPKVSGFTAQAGLTALEPPVDAEELLAATLACLTVEDELRTELRERAAAGIDWLDRTLRSGRATIGA